jgi:recombination associated protein RdgC
MKLLKAAITYKCNLPGVAALETHLQENPFQELMALDFGRAGFVPNPHDARFVTPLTGTKDYAFTVRYDEKIIPSNVVNKEVTKRVLAIEEQEQRKVPKKERAGIKDEVYVEMLGRALIKSVEITCFYRPDDRLLIVPTASKKLADIVISRLLKSVGSIKAETIYVTEAKQGLTTKLEGHFNDHYEFQDFNIEGDCKLKAPEGNAFSVKLDDINLAKGGILEAIGQGAKVVELGLSNDDMYFRINSDFVIKGIAFIAEPAEQPEFDNQLDYWLHEATAQVLLFAATHKNLLTLFEYKEPETETETA